MLLSSAIAIAMCGALQAATSGPDSIAAGAVCAQAAGVF
jgi:hypothetical protein